MGSSATLLGAERSEGRGARLIKAIEAAQRFLFSIQAEDGHWRGGLDACNSFTKIYLAIFGQYPWSRCPSVPPELILFPRRFYLNIYEVSSWSRAILVPLSIISARKPSCPVPSSAAIPELMSDARKPLKRTAWTSFCYAVDTVVKQVEKLPLSALRTKALER